ncbi:hypothetical protein [Streptococcus danieliae]|uniref:Uncharacterized protein n=1 Tax=Streptococcus danieliae TaxID=747656 RepID=A0A7Z0M5P1_9STRE|nr:hypothetical protein [Streptococcus danieliae]MBF0699179.1 hypothetical protein [Streptococcus danieliae]NYS96355.1 hypothetical protein [Streptococcus danieliae]
MIGLNFVYERDELLYSLDLPIELQDPFSVDYLDFDHQSFEDLIDYMDFLEFDRYIFVAVEESSRLQRLVNYLSDKVEYPITTLEMNALGKLLSDEQVINVQKVLENHSGYQTLGTLKTEEVFENGYRAFRSAMYPHLTKGLLKHVQVDEVNTFLSENKDLIPRFAINSAIYSDTDCNDPSNPFIVRSIANFSKMETFARLTELELRDALEEFLKSGRLMLTNHILDYGILTGISRFNSLVFKQDTFYLDSAMNIPIGDSGESFQKLFNEASMKLGRQVIDANNEIWRLVPLLIAMNRTYNDLEFVTPYNQYHLAAIEDRIVSLNWIAFKNSDHYFAFNLPNSRIFKINQVVFEKLEYIIKNRLDERDLVMQKVVEVLETYA